jgi:hypothetical protein
MSRKAEFERAIKRTDHGLTTSEHHILLAFFTHTNPDGVAWPSPGTLAKQCAFKDESPNWNGTRLIKRRLASLERKGWLEKVEKGEGGARTSTSKRRLTIPAAFESVPARATSGPEATGTHGPGTTGQAPTSGPGAIPPVAGEPPEVDVEEDVRRRAGMDGGEPAEFVQLLESLNGSPPMGAQRGMFRAAYTEAPEGFAAVVKQAAKGTSPFGLLTRLIERGAHLQVQERRSRIAATVKQPVAREIDDDCPVHGRTAHRDDGVSLPVCLRCEQAAA